MFFGFYPDPLINTIEVSVSDLINMYNIILIINNMNNLNLVLPEIFISLSIMFLLVLGVFKKDSSRLI